MHPLTSGRLRGEDKVQGMCLRKHLSSLPGPPPNRVLPLAQERSWECVWGRGSRVPPFPLGVLPLGSSVQQRCTDNAERPKKSPIPFLWGPSAPPASGPRRGPTPCARRPSTRALPWGRRTQTHLRAAVSCIEMTYFHSSSVLPTL